jgi:hypothetical protein
MRVPAVWAEWCRRVRGEVKGFRAEAQRKARRERREELRWVGGASAQCAAIGPSTLGFLGFRWVLVGGHPFIFNNFLGSFGNTRFSERLFPQQEG